MSYLRLLRLPNLLIVALTQYFMRYLIVEPLLIQRGFELQMPPLPFFLLVLATVSLTAAGYVINDYFDTRSDYINRPGRVVVGTSVSRRKAILLHTLLNALGVVLGVYLAIYVKIPYLALFFIAVSGILWLYSTTYKRRFLIGNLIVALLTGLVPVLVPLFEVPLLHEAYAPVIATGQTSFNFLFYWVGAFGFFAFITSVIREIIKDVQDYQGDKEIGCKTLPVKWGLSGSKRVIFSLIIITAAALGVIYVKLLPHIFVFAYFLIALWIPFVILIVLVLKSNESKDFAKASGWTKFIMLTGILFAFVVFFMIKNNVL
ncbi:MAG: geranylgeranylglycerol-phosphate geranylgeranyltransferase [Bacteroidales bacterium]|jgi:4-hydroxybenzoate polyprenyltransferase